MSENSFVEKIEKIKMLYRVLILVGTVVVLAGLFVFLFYLPKSEQISLVEQEISVLEQKIAQAKIRTKNLAKLEGEEAEVEAQFHAALTLLPNQREIPTLLSNITQLGSDADLDFLFFSPQRERSRDFFIEIPVSMEVAGNYHNVALFFEKVGHMKRIVNILNVSMKPDKERSTNLKTRCDAVTYRFKGKDDEQAESDKKKKK